MLILLRFLARILILAALAVFVLLLTLWFAEYDLAVPGGLLWLQIHTPSLQYAQVVTERHLGLETLWQDWIQGALLQLPVWQGGLWLGGVFLLPGVILLLLARRRRGRSGYGGKRHNFLPF